MFGWLKVNALAVELIGLLVAVVGVFYAGYHEGTRRAEQKAQTERAQAVELALATKQADIERAQAVTTAYANVASLLRQAGIKSQVEVRHEVERVEYRCVLPDGGRLLLDQAVGRANDAAAGRAGGGLPADRQPAAP